MSLVFGECHAIVQVKKHGKILPPDSSTDKKTTSVRRVRYRYGLASAGLLANGSRSNFSSLAVTPDMAKHGKAC